MRYIATKHPEIFHSYDILHKSKNLRKVMTKVNTDLHTVYHFIVHGVISGWEYQRHE